MKPVRDLAHSVFALPSHGDDLAREMSLTGSPEGDVPMEEQKSFLDSTTLAIVVSATIILVGIWIGYLAG